MKYTSNNFILFFLFILLFIVSCNRSNTSNIEENNQNIEIKKRFGIPISDYNISDCQVESGESLSSILSNQGLPYAKINECIDVCKKNPDFLKLKTGNNYFVFKTKDTSETLKFLVYQNSPSTFVKFCFGDSINIIQYELPIRTDTITVSGKIESSLWMCCKNAGIDPTLALSLSDIYAWSVDFYGLQKGDSFNLVYEKEFIDTTYVGIGRILACNFVSSGTNYQAYLFEQDSISNYFNEKGLCLKGAFLKAPLKFSRISSTFTNSRLHPILKIRRPHHGVDYAAPIGTPVHSIGNGKVISIKYSGGYGRRVEIKHNNVYSTGYAHLSKFAAGLKVGQTVTQGQIIGYVGASGLATGPHLDFRVYKNGEAVDPLTLKSPPAIPINSANKDAFDKQMKYWQKLLAK